MTSIQIPESILDLLKDDANYEDVCNRHPEVFIELMNHPVKNVIHYISYIQYCLEKLTKSDKVEETECESESDTDSVPDAEDNTIYMYFDGCSKGNPGHSGAGCVIYDNESTEIWSSYKYIGNDKTNNYAEYYSLIMGLRRLDKMKLDSETNVIIRGDSQLIIRQMTGESKVRSKTMKSWNNLAQRLVRSISAETIEFQHVLREYNKRADELANQAVKESID